MSYVSPPGGGLWPAAARTQTQRRDDVDRWMEGRKEGNTTAAAGKETENASGWEGNGGSVREGNII